MPRRSDKLLKNELSSLTGDGLIRSLLLPDLLNDAVYHNHLSDLLALAELLVGLRYLNPRSISSAGRLPIADGIRVPQLPRGRPPRKLPYDAGELLGSCRAA